METLKPMLFTTLKNYSRAQFIKDITAGIIVAIIALPLSIALALASALVQKQVSLQQSLQDFSPLPLVEAQCRFPVLLRHLQPSLPESSLPMALTV